MPLNETPPIKIFCVRHWRLGWRTPRVDNLKLAELAYIRIENPHEVRKKTFVSIYVAVIYTTPGGTELGLPDVFCNHSYQQ